MMLSTVLVSLLVQGASPAAADLTLPWVFQDHMVLQHGEVLPVWGQAAAGATVTVRFGSVVIAGTADSKGAWRVELPPQSVSKRGAQLSVKTGQASVVLDDVLVGDVWLCAGQSNMDYSVQRSTGGELLLAGLDPMPEIRLCNRTGSPVGGSLPLTKSELAKITPGAYYTGSWARAEAGTVAGFSAIGFHFGLAVAARVDVPLGLIDVSLDAASTEGWVPLDALRRDALTEPLTEQFWRTPLTHTFIRRALPVHLEAWFESGMEGPRPRHFFEPGFLYESAIESLAPFPLKGVLWYQGESNTHRPDVAGHLFRTMVAEWRRAFAKDDLAVYFVQLPALRRADWPAFREEQARWLDIPHTGMAVALDVGHPINGHPPNKAPIARRLAALALSKSYGLDVTCLGPRLRGKSREGKSLVLVFDNAEGLRLRSSDATVAVLGPAFEVAGSGGRYYPASAATAGDRITLTSPEVDAPLTARYAWAPFPDHCLMNVDLPAAPFRETPQNPVRIACIGDSITAGYGLEDPSTQSYPARLQARLGDGFEVLNFGHSGASAGPGTKPDGSPRPYRKQLEHEAALAFAPQIVVCNLGINDTLAWASSGPVLVEQYQALLAEYAGLESAPTILIWGPLAPLFPGHPSYGSVGEKEIEVAVTRVASELGLPLIDMNSPFESRSDWFPDALHPDARGAESIAGVVHRALIREELAPDTRPLQRIYVLTGQSNSLGTTADPAEPGAPPSANAMDAHVKLFWSNRWMTASGEPIRSLGSSGGEFQSLQVQQGAGANKTFWGPEVGFGRSLYAAGERDFVIVKASRAGGGNSFWKKGSDDDQMYTHIVETVNSAIRALPDGMKFEVAALLYIQGEGDAAEEAGLSGERLRLLAENLRADLPHAREMRVLVGGIAAEGQLRDVVRESQAAACATEPLMAYAATIDLRPGLYDKLHFDAASKLEVGRRLAELWETLGGAAAHRAAVAKSKR